MGVGRALKENNPRIKIVCAHPVKGHYIQGLKNMDEAIVPSIYDPSLIDETLMVETEVAYEMEWPTCDLESECKILQSDL